MFLPYHIYKIGYNLLAKSTYYPFRVSCVIFKGKRIIATGFNQIRTAKHLPHQYIRFHNSLHAEAHAAMDARFDIKRCSILVMRQNVKTGMINMARPCEYCYSLLADCNAKEMFYTGREGTVVYERIN